MVRREEQDEAPARCSLGMTTMSISFPKLKCSLSAMSDDGGSMGVAVAEGCASRHGLGLDLGWHGDTTGPRDRDKHGTILWPRI